MVLSLWLTLPPFSLSLSLSLSLPLPLSCYRLAQQVDIRKMFLKARGHTRQKVARGMQAAEKVLNQMELL